MSQYVINIGALPNDGTGDPLRTAFNETNLNFNQIFAAGPVLSNIQIANNTILTTNTNGNLVLAPNGIGVVQSNVNIVPDSTRIRNLGSSSLRWNTVYTQYATVYSDLSVGGNLSVVGNVIQIGNIVTDSLTIQLANTASTANAANGAGITVGANDNIATILYNSTSNAWTTNVGLNLTGNILPTANVTYNLGSAAYQWKDIWVSNATIYMNSIPVSLTTGNVLTVNGEPVLTNDSNTSITTTGNITADYFIGDGSLLTGISTGIQSSIANGASNVSIPVANGNVDIYSNNGAGNSAQWTFTSRGNVFVPPETSFNTGAGTNGNINFHPDGSGTVNISGASAVLLRLAGDVTNTLNRIEIDTYGNSNVLGGTFAGSFHRGTFLNPLSVQSGDRLASFKGKGHNGSAFVSPTGQISIDAVGTWSNTSAGTHISFWTTPTESTTIQESARINAGGDYHQIIGNIVVDNGAVNANGNITANYFIGNGSQLTGVAATGNLDIVGTTISIADGAPETYVDISASVGGWAYVQVPTDATANVYNTRIHNDAGNIEFGTGNYSTGATGYIWVLGNDGNLVIPGIISSSSTIVLDNRASGNAADIQLYSADDILLQGRDKPSDSENEGGDINILAGIGAAAVTSGNDTGGGGDIQITGGTGGAAEVTATSGSAGGFVSIRGGDGGTSLDSNAGSGGDINLTAGSASGATTTALGGLGGGVNIIAGTTTRINENGGSISLNTGSASGDGTGAAGYVEINIASSNVGPGGQWVFGGTGQTLNVPANAEIYGANYGNFTVGCAGNTIITSSDYGANVKNWVFGYTGNLELPPSGNLVGQTANNSGHINWVGNSSGDSYGYTTMNLVPDNTVNDSYVILDPTSPNHIHIRAGGTQDNSGSMLYLGGENSYFKVDAGVNPNVYVTANSNVWTFDTTGNLTLPTISLGSGIDEQTVISSQRKLIPPFRYSAVIDGSTPTVVYTATNVQTTSMKVTIQIQHTGLGFEFFEVFATYTGSTDTWYTVSNRVAPPTIDASTVVVDLNGSNTMQITVTIESGAATSWVTYDAVEFGIPVD